MGMRGNPGEGVWSLLGQRSSWVIKGKAPLLHRTSSYLHVIPGTLAAFLHSWGETSPHTGSWSKKTDITRSLTTWFRPRINQSWNHCSWIYRVRLCAIIHQDVFKLSFLLYPKSSQMLNFLKAMEETLMPLTPLNNIGIIIITIASFHCYTSIVTMYRKLF